MRYSDVREFHEKMELPAPAMPQLMPRESLATRLVYMLEELGEFSQKHRNDDLAGAADSLVDLVYFALGTAVQMGLPWHDIWKLVHDANMKKVPGLDKYGAKGVIKPAGWQSPDRNIAGLLKSWGVPLPGEYYQKLLAAVGQQRTVSEILVWMLDEYKSLLLQEWAESGANFDDIPEFCL